MILEAIIGGGVLYCISRNFVQIDIRLKPNSIARTVEKARQTVTDVTEQIKKQLISEAVWQESKAREKAQAMYNRAIGGVFENATEEEKEALLNLFKKYMPED